DVTHPLVVDSDGDGVCDTINPNVVPVTGMPPGPSQAVEINLVQIPPAGGADFVPPTYAGPVGGGLSCLQGDDQQHPNPLCLTSGPLTIAISNSVQQPPEPLISTIP